MVWPTWAVSGMVFRHKWKVTFVRSERYLTLHLPQWRTTRSSPRICLSTVWPNVITWFRKKSTFLQSCVFISGQPWAWNNRIWCITGTCTYIHRCTCKEKIHSTHWAREATCWMMAVLVSVPRSTTCWTCRVSLGMSSSLLTRSFFFPGCDIKLLLMHRCSLLQPSSSWYCNTHYMWQCDNTTHTIITVAYA